LIASPILPPSLSYFVYLGIGGLRVSDAYVL
jgi:hypothetical protein